jgi:hypothetical protein
MDIADKAQAVSDMFLCLNLAGAHRPAPMPEATGECLFCGQPVVDGRRWCDVECRNDWEREAQRTRRH